MNVLKNESGKRCKNKNQQNGAKFRHLKDPFFILCIGIQKHTELYRIGEKIPFIEFH